MTRDARIPVRFVRHSAVPEADQVLLLPEPAGAPADGDGGAPGWLAVLHLPSPDLSRLVPPRASCRCCPGRPAQAPALTWLFHARARGEIGFFRGVVAHLPRPQEAALRDVLSSDLFLRGRFVQAN